MSQDKLRIGVYVCHCGINISRIVDVERVTEFAKGLPSVVIARTHKYMCSDPGQTVIKDDIKEYNLNRVVVASCSPHMHEPTFRRACQEAGLNQYLFEMANIREHCSWVHEDKEMATEKAKALVSAAVSRVSHHAPLETKEVTINPNVLVIGGGIAGIQAALDIANSGKQVYLVEKEASIGGHMAQYDKTFPTLDCAACILTPKMTQVRQHPFIKLFNYSEVEEISGFVGNFKAVIKRKARYIDENKCTGCEQCIEVCPSKVDSEFDLGLSKRKAVYKLFPQAVPNKVVIDAANCLYLQGREQGKDVCRLCEKGIPGKDLPGCETGAINFEDKDEFVEVDCGGIIVTTGFNSFDAERIYQYGHGRYNNVITSLQFERMSNASGPTDGEIVLKDGSKPNSVAILHCVGSRDENYNQHCSRLCCMSSLKYAHLLGEKLPDAKIYQLYIDMRCAGPGYEEFYKRIQHEEVTFIRGRAGEITNIAETPEEKGKLIVICEDTLIRRKLRLPVDMVVLSGAIEPRSNAEQVARIFSCSRRADGFFMEKHPKLGPVETMTDGVYIAGCCQSPQDIPDTVAQASAAAAKAMAIIDRGKVEIEAAIAHINEEQCSGCKICVELCPYSAISFDEEKEVSVINEALCKGCGTCVSACPSAAIEGRHFTTQQILSEIEGVLHDV